MEWAEEENQLLAAGEEWADEENKKITATLQDFVLLSFKKGVKFSFGYYKNKF